MTVDWIWPTTADISAIRSPIKWQLQTKKEKKKTEGKLIHLSYNAIHPIKKPSG